MTAVERFQDMYEHYREAGDDYAVEVLDAAWKHARVQSWELRQGGR